MSSVEELRARIAKLSIEVDLQKEVLKNLEKNKSIAQRQLNAFLDPVACLPVEISSDISLQSLPRRSEPSAQKVPMLLLSFLKRSSPKALRELVISRAAGPVGTELVECLLLIPSLTRLEMWWPQSQLFIDLLTALAESPSLLSGLNSLAVCIYPSRVVNLSSCWTALLHALVSCRAHVRQVQIEVLQDKVNEDIAVKPAEEILSAFRELTGEGMQLYIGSKSNFI
ncbi:hypothetical protein C8R47DRAFT_1088395 [Mycena vitilis]|nr:hypothetical protein C8R47DRAFT_1088395 [Mycena vitilis]